MAAHHAEEGEECALCDTLLGVCTVYYIGYNGMRSHIKVQVAEAIQARVAKSCLGFAEG